jgi:hypothetical protein
VRLGASLPRDVADNVLYLTLARRALDAKNTDVALAAARRETQLFNWSIWPRLLSAEAALAAGRAARAGPVGHPRHAADGRGRRSGRLRRSGHDRGGRER